MKVKQLKEWLNNFIDEADVEFTVHPNQERYLTRYRVLLHITIDGKPLGATLDLNKEVP